MTVIRWLAAGITAAFAGFLGLLPATHLAHELPRSLPLAGFTVVVVVALLAVFVRPVRPPVVAIVNGNGSVLRFVWRIATRHVRFAVLLGLAVSGVVWSAAYLLPPWLVVAAIVVSVLAPGIPRSRRGETEWWSNRSLAAHLVQAGVLPATKADAAPWHLYYPHPPHRDESGDHVMVELPAARTYADVAAKRDRLAASLGVPAARLHLTQEPGDPEGRVRIFLANPRPTGTARAAVATAEQTNWRDPVRIGTDPRGQVIELGTNECNTLISGMMGFGKTATARLLTGHYLLDSSTLIYGCDGKASFKDYELVAGMAEQWVWGTDDDPAEAMLEVFRHLLTMIKDRNHNSRTQPNPPGVLLILEEYQDIRAAARDDKARKVLDAELGRIIRMARAVRFHVLISTQRPSVEDLPSGQRNLLNQRIALVTSRAADAALVLGHTPTLPLPTRKGEAIVALPTQDHAVAIDYLNDDDWEALCARAAQLRSTVRNLTVAAHAETPQEGTRPVLRLVPDTTVAEPIGSVPEPAATGPVGPNPDPADPLEVAVLHVLATGDPRGMSATQLAAALPDDVRPPSPVALGKRLRGYRSVALGRNGKSPAWQLAANPRQPSQHPSQPPAASLAGEGSEGPNGPRPRSDRAAGETHAPTLAATDLNEGSGR